MSRHTTTGHWQLGLLLALITMLAWATLPVALKLTLEFMDAYTLTWFRFLIAATLLTLWFWRRGLIKPFRGKNRTAWLLLLLSAAGLTGNYILYLLGLDLTSPANAQVLIQLAPILMGLGGIVLFGERYKVLQWLGFSILIAGLGVFFRHQLTLFSDQSATLWQGALLLVFAAFSWAAYALAQKQLLRDFSSARIMLFIYAFAALVLLPTGDLEQLQGLNPGQWLLVVFCALNTLIAYGAFAEALNHWQASRVSAILALTPLGTLAVAAVVSHWLPQLLAPERLDWISISGASLVVAGSMLTSLAGARRRVSTVAKSNDTT